MVPSVLLLLLFVPLSSTDSLPPPRTSFLLNSADRPLAFFSLPNLHNLTTLLLSADGSTLYAGARDALLSLDVSHSDVIKLKNMVEWSPSEAETKACAVKVKNPEADCPNFVRVLQPLNSTHLYACGSNAYSPRDAYIDTESFTVVQGGSAKGRCPFSPFQRSSAIAVDGELFTATMTNFMGDVPQISRHFSKDGRPDVNQDISVILNKPTFVGSSSDPSHRKLYFFFNEVGKEFSFVDELQIARVAQVCKDDIGGQRTLQKRWTSFAKGSLLCRAPKQLPFNVLQDMFTLQPPEGSNASDTLFYGIFTSQWSSAGGESAVCAFKLQDVRAAFAGSYRTFDTQTHLWSPMLGKHAFLGKCGLDSASDAELEEVKKSFLTSSGVKPAEDGPVLVSSGQSYSRVVAMTTPAADGKQYKVLFLLTESGFLHKVGLFHRGAQVIEEIQVFTQPQLVKSIVLSTSKGVLYVGTSEGVAAVPVARCSIHRSCSQCVLSRDPLCGWSRSARVCTRVDGSHDDIAQDLEDVNVEEQCRGQSQTHRPTEVSVHLNEAVRLQCRKPSNLATLSWTSPRNKELPGELFILSADGTLSFLASAATFGSYHCEAQEGRHQEVVRSYAVLRAAPPRGFSPDPTGAETHESDEDLGAETPEAPGESTTKDDGAVSLEDETDSKMEDSEKTTSAKNIPTPRGEFRKELPDQPAQMSGEKSYYSELVVVSLLLAACVCVLMLAAGLHVWRRRGAGLKQGPSDEGNKAGQSMESIPSLSSPEDPEVKVVK